jgi:hypothetical protein
MTLRRPALLVAVPLAFSVLPWFHPMVSDYDGLRDVTTRFQIVHVAMVLVLPVLAAGAYLLLDGLRRRAAAVGRLALIPFVVFYVPYVAFEGIALGVLGEQLNGLTAGQRDAVARGMVQDFASNPILGEPGLFWALGSTALTVVMVSTVLASRRAGAPLTLQVLLDLSALIERTPRRSPRSAGPASPPPAGSCCERATPRWRSRPQWPPRRSHP